MPLNKIIDAIARTINCDTHTIHPQARIDSLGIDSLKAINIVYDLEEEFGIEVPNEAIADLVTVNDIEATISRLLNEK